jgi:adenosylhomocysteinase
MPAVEAARVGDVFITVTGNRGVLGREHFEAMSDGAILANAGHFDVEIDKPALALMSVSTRVVRPHVEEHLLGDGRRINLLADGRVVNLAAAEGHPAAVMDMGFSAHALSVEHIARAGGALEKRVHPLPETIDAEIARLKLESLGMQIDELTAAQLEYLHSWEQGT